MQQQRRFEQQAGAVVIFPFDDGAAIRSGHKALALAKGAGNSRVLALAIRVLHLHCTVD